MFSEEEITPPRPSEDSLPYLEGRYEGGTFLGGEGVSRKGRETEEMSLVGIHVGSQVRQDLPLFYEKEFFDGSTREED